MHYSLWNRVLYDRIFKVARNSMLMKSGVMMENKTGEKEKHISLIMEKYESMLLSYAYNLTGDYEKSQDVVQDTFLKLCKADMEKIEAYLKAWLFKVCRNRALEIKSFSRVCSLIETLPEKQQEVVYLKFKSDLSYKEISEIADISVSNVGVILHTAITALRTQMLQEV